MDRDGGPEERRGVSLMTLHSAKGLEFENVFLPGWEEGLFPSQRTLDEQGRARSGRGAPPRPCRADPCPPPRKALFRHQPAHSRHLDHHDPVAPFLDELPAASVEITESKGGGGLGRPAAVYGPSRFDNV